MRKNEEMQNIDQLISLYISGKADKEVLKELKEFVVASEENRRYVHDRLEIWFSAGAIESTDCFDKEKAFSLFKEKVRRSQAAGKKTFSFSVKFLYRVAAILLLVLLPIAGYWKGIEMVKSSFSDIIVEAPVGARTKLYLPDGTLVWLNAGSRIVYSQGFGVDNRNLILEGEGYFEVTKNKKIPFKIDTEELDLEVLGTKFNFRSYLDDEEVTVCLVEGKVALRNEMNPGSTVYMESNEKIILDKRTGNLIKIEGGVGNAILWTKDELYFDEELLVDIAKKLSRSFGVEIEVADSISERRFYGTFRITGNTIEQVLETIALTNQMNYRKENEKYILY